METLKEVVLKEEKVYSGESSWRFWSKIKWSTSGSRESGKSWPESVVKEAAQIISQEAEKRGWVLQSLWRAWRSISFLKGDMNGQCDSQS